MKTPLPPSVANPQPTPEQQKALTEISRESDRDNIVQALVRAAAKGDLWLMQKIKESGFEMNEHVERGGRCGSYPLAAAIVAGNKESVWFLLANGAKAQLDCYIQDNHQEPLKLALQENKLDIADLLIEYGAQWFRKDFLHIVGAGRLDIASKMRAALPPVLEPLFVERIKAAAGDLDVSDLLRDRPEPKVEPRPPPSPWQKVGKMAIAYISVDEIPSKKITDVFNFESRERTYIVDDVTYKTTWVEHCPFDKIENRHWLEAACDAFNGQGGKIDKGEVMTKGIVPRKMQKL